MDCYIHCIESLTVTYLNSFSKSYGEKALDLCRRVYLEKDEVAAFNEMVAKHGIEIPSGICANLSDEDFDKMIDVSLGLVPLWKNALGKNWQAKITREKLRALYEKM